MLDNAREYQEAKLIEELIDALSHDEVSYWHDVRRHARAFTETVKCWIRPRTVGFRS